METSHSSESDYSEFLGLYWYRQIEGHKPKLRSGDSSINPVGEGELARLGRFGNERVA